MGRTLALVALFTSLVAGCSCGAPVLRPCTSSRDCRSGTVCSSGRCVARADGTVEDDAGPYDAGVTLDALPFDGASCAVASDEVLTQPVDIIVVVDQSASTGEERDAIEANIGTNLVNVLEANRVDYHVILINSDPALCPEAPLRLPGSDCMASNLPRYLRVPQAVNNSDELTLILWTYEGDGKRPNSCVRVPDAVPAWRDAVRPGALKVFIVFSDDDPTSYRASGAPPSCSAPGGPGFAGCSSASCPNLDCEAVDWGSVCPNFGCPTFAAEDADWNDGRDFLTELQALDPPGMFGGPDAPLVIFHSIIGVTRTLEPTEPLTDRCDRCDFAGNTAENSGVTYQMLSRTTGGLRFPSCNTDYSAVFERISDTLRPLACEFLIEQTGPDPIDPGLVNVTFDPGDGSPALLIPQDAMRTCDAGADGWQWNAGFTRIRLCGPACDRASASASGSVSITVGCDTITAPF